MVRTIPRAPLLWMLLPLAGGTWAGTVVPASATPVLLAGAGTLALVAGIASWMEGRWADLGWVVAFPAAVLLAGTALQAERRQPPAGWPGLPAREASLEVRVVRVFSSREPDRFALIGTITAAPPHLRDLVGREIFCGGSLGPGQGTPVRTQTLAVTGVLDFLGDDPDLTGFEGHLLATGTAFSLSRAGIDRATGDPTAFHAWCHRTANRLQGHLAQALRGHEHQATLLSGMILGRAVALDEATRDGFRRTGTAHLFSVSGLHVALVAGVLHTLLAAARCPRPVAAVAGLVALYLFVEISGAAPSAMRAYVMCAWVWLATVVQRAPNYLAALTAAATFSLLWEPDDLFRPGFQLSYGVVAALLLYGGPLGTWLGQTWAPFTRVPEDQVPRWRRARDASLRAVAGSLGIGIAAFLGSLPASTAHFGLVANLAIPVNLIVVPAAMLAVTAGVAAMAAAMVGIVPLAAVFAHAALPLLWFVEGVVGLGAGLPGSTITAMIARDALAVAAQAAFLVAAAVVLPRSEWQGWRFLVPPAVLCVFLLPGVGLA